ncbi:MAG: NYN domain-containing protein, partial [Armatimonas sp.]
WGAFRDYRSDLLDNATEPVQTFALTQRGKNGADIRIAIDVMELALRHGDISHVALVSGDSDFTPLVMKLRELGLEVIGVGVRSNTSTYLAKSCDRFLFYEDIICSNNLPPQVIEHEEIDTGRLLALALAQLGNRPVAGSVLKNRMRQIDARFDETRHGYDSFLDFLRAHGELVDIYKPAVGDVSVAPKGMLPPLSGAIDEPSTTLMFRSASYKPYVPENGIPYQAPAPIESPVSTLADAYYDWLRENNFRYVPASERQEVTEVVYQIFASSEEPLSLKEAKDRLHAWFEENRPAVPWESVNSTVYHLFYTWCFRFDKTDEGEGKQLWDRRTFLVEEIGSADDLKERVERGIVRKLWERERGV